MVGPIYPTGAASIRPPGIVPATRFEPTTTAASGGQAAAAPPGGAGVLGNSQAIAEVFSAVAAMLEEFGGGLEDDQVLQALIALLILMTLLQGAQDANASQQSALGEGGLGAGSGSLLMASSYTKTTIFIEHTSVTSTFQLPAESAAAFDLGQLDSSGGSIDLLG